MYLSLLAKLQGYYHDLLPLDFATQHGQQSDQPAASWAFRDIALSRRTGLFAATLTQLARRTKSPDAIALAYGALAGYAGNAIGSAYLNQTIGGARRAYPYRSGSLPSVFLTAAAGAPLPAVSSYGAQLWRLEALDSNDSDVRNVDRNLDGDRGPMHECWSLPSGSIATDPLAALTILGYGEV